MNQLSIHEPGVISALSRSEVDAQLAISRQYPRDLELFHARAHALATKTEAVAAECIYSIPREGKLIEGPSVRLAEILVANWGNCRAGARIVEEGSEYVTAQGVFHDLESNAITTFETRRRIIDKRGRRYSGDMVTITSNAACAIALRQAVLKGIPKPYWEGLFAAVRQKAAGNAADLPERRAKALKAFAAMNVSEARILARLGVEQTNDITAEHIVTLAGIYNAIREGEATAAEAFPEPEATKPDTGTPTTIEEFANQGTD